MPRKFPLAAVLAVREQKEEAEERALGAIGVRIAEVRAGIARIDSELLRHRDVRVAEIATLHSAAHHLATASRWRMLGEARTQLLNQCKQLDLQRSEQMTRYLVARGDREMLTELQNKQREAWNAEVENREAKRVADLFAGRRHRSQG